MDHSEGDRRKRRRRRVGGSGKGERFGSEGFDKLASGSVRGLPLLLLVNFNHSGVLEELRGVGKMKGFGVLNPEARSRQITRLR